MHQNQAGCLKLESMPGSTGTLIEHVYAAAKAANGSRVRWLTHESNDTAMQLYDRIAERHGFVQYRKRLD